MDVAGKDGKILIFVYENAFVPALVQVAHAIVSSIVIACIGYVEFAHEFGKVAEWRFDQKMEMVAHEDVAVKFYRINIVGLDENLEKPLAICVVSEDGLPFVSAARDVVDRVRILDTEGPGHEQLISRKGAMCQHVRFDPNSPFLAAPEEEMDVIGHQIPGVDGAFSLSYIETESLKEEAPVLIVFEYVGFVDAPHHDMVQGAGYIESSLARHQSIILKKGTLSRNISKIYQLETTSPKYAEDTYRRGNGRLWRSSGQIAEGCRLFIAGAGRRDRHLSQDAGPL